MSQITNSSLSKPLPPTVVETLTGNSGGAVSPAGNNINVIGDTTTINIVGNPGTNTLTVSTSGAVADSFVTDAGTATPALGVLTVHGTHNINTSGAGSTVSIQNNNTATFGDLSVVLVGNPSMTLTSGDLTVSGTGVGAAGNINIPATSSSSIGVINQAGLRFIHTYNAGSGSTNTFVGNQAGNFTLSGAGGDARNVGIGGGALTALTTGIFNTAVGTFAADHITTGSANAGIGNDVLGGISGTGAGTGNGNSALGLQALGRITSAKGNTAAGIFTASNISTGSFNIAVGGGDFGAAPVGGALGQLTTGSNNICIGADLGAGSKGAGWNYTGAESNNILLGGATLGTLGESNVMRLGTSGAGAGQVNSTWVAGTYGVTPAVSGTNQMVISNNLGQFGTQTIPSNPASSCKFVAYNAANISNVTGDATNYGPVIFGSTVVNTGAAYATGTGIFTAPNTGFYSFSTTLKISGLVASHTNALLFFVGSVNTYTVQETNPGVIFTVDGTNVLSLTGSIMIPMTAADTMQVSVAVSGGAKVVSVLGEALPNVETFFMGYQVA